LHEARTVHCQGLGIRSAERHHRRVPPVQSARFLPVSRLRARIAARSGRLDSGRDRIRLLQEDQCRRAFWFGERASPPRFVWSTARSATRNSSSVNAGLAQNWKMLTSIRFRGPAVPVVPT